MPIPGWLLCLDYYAYVDSVPLCYPFVPVYARESKLCTRYVRTLFGHSIYLAVVLAKVGRREKTAGIEVASRY
ncbi:hypothetical protein NEUTE1DRAFT_117284, partial [Neurospora tetrasperma FGSC 2508]